MKSLKICQIMIWEHELIMLCDRFFPNIRFSENYVSDLMTHKHDTGYYLVGLQRSKKQANIMYDKFVRVILVTLLVKPI